MTIHLHASCGRVPAPPTELRRLGRRHLPSGTFQSSLAGPCSPIPSLGSLPPDAPWLKPGGHEAAWRLKARTEGSMSSAHLSWNFLVNDLAGPWSCVLFR